MKKYVLVVIVISGMICSYQTVGKAGLQESVYEERTIMLPEFNTEKYLETLSRNIGKAEPLSKNLDKASQELNELYEQYQKNPTPLLEAQIEDKLSQHLTLIVRGMEDIITGRDEIEWAMKDLTKETEQVKESLMRESGNLKDKQESYSIRTEKLEKELSNLARSIQRAKDPDTKNQLIRDFRKRLIEYHLTRTYVKSYGDMNTSYVRLTEGMDTMLGAFDGMESKVMGLIDSMEEQRGFLIFAAKMRGSLAEVKEKMTKGIAGGKYSLANLADKMQTLTGRLELFNQVAKQMEGSLNEFTSIKDAISAITTQGATPGSAATSPVSADDLAKTIEYWSVR